MTTHGDARGAARAARPGRGGAGDLAPSRSAPTTPRPGRSAPGTLLAVLVGLAFPLLLLAGAHRANGYDGFPLDDAWIHLTYARNLAAHGAFTYFPGEPSSAGSTAPLYTLLLAAGFRLTSNEKALSYALDLACHLAFLLVLAAWARRRLGSAAWAAIAVLLVALDPRVGILAVSGMETSLLLLLVALAFHARLAGRAWLTGLALALALWVRPDGLVLVGVFALDALLDRLAPPARAAGTPIGADARPWLALLPGLAVALGYFVFNEGVGGRLLPNTFAAKTAYYATYSRSNFLRADVLGGFTAGAWLVLAPFALGALAREAWRLARRRPGVLRPEAGWAVALVLAYLVLLPFPHRFSRYLVPALPALALLGLAGLRDLAARLGRGRVFRWRGAAGALAALVLLAAGGLAVRAAARGATEYRNACRYHHVRHERTGRWLAGHTPPGAVIATHDVGAIAYYSGRRVVDMVGVVQPEATAHLNRPDYTGFLERLFAREGVGYVATLQNWQEVANAAPLFTADPEPEVLEVYPWVPGVTRLVPPAVSALDRQASRALEAGDVAGAERLLQASLAADSLIARTWVLVGAARETGHRWADAERAYARATSLFPGSPEALAGRALALAELGRRDEAIALLERLLATRPDYPGARALQRYLKG